MGQINVGVGGYHISNQSGDVIKTFALGSCVALLVYDKILKIAGMVHIALPDSTVNDYKNEDRAGYFADTGIPLLLKEMNKLGAVRKNSWIKLTGGANINDPSAFFDIGKRNVLTVKKILWKQSLGILKEDTGGNFSRTVSIAVDDGQVIVSTGGVGGKSWLL